MKRNKILGLLAIMLLCVVAAFAAACSPSSGSSGSGGTDDSGDTNGSTGDTGDTDGYIGTTGFIYTGYNEANEVTTDEAAISYYAITSVGTALGETNVYIPRAYRQKPVTQIGEEAFLNNRHIRSVTIKENIDYIGVSAFANCIGLTNLILDSTLTDGIDDNAFDGCTSLSIVDFSGSVAQWCALELGNYAANPLSNGALLYIADVLLTELVVPDTVTTINPAVFYGCESLESVTMGESVTEIGIDAFSECINLTSLTIGSKVETIGVGAFYRNSSLETVVIPAGVIAIADYTFSLCNRLSNITMGDNVATIGEYAFYGCTSLYSMVMSSKLTSIGQGAYMNSALYAVMFNGTAANWASNVTVAADNEPIANAAVFAFSETRAAGRCWHYEESVPTVWASEHLVFTGHGEDGLVKTEAADIVYYVVSKGTVSDAGITDIVIPPMHEGKPVTEISTEGFMNLTACTSIYIPTTITKIGSQAFYGCSALTELVIPAAVTEIGSQAFYNCTALTSLKILGSSTVVGNQAYTGCTALKYIVVGGVTIWFTTPPEVTTPEPTPTPEP